MKNVKNTFSKSGNVSFLIFFETPNFLAWTFSGNEVSEELRAENYVEFQYSSQCEVLKRDCSRNILPVFQMERRLNNKLSINQISARTNLHRFRLFSVNTNFYRQSIKSITKILSLKHFGIWRI